MKNKNKLFEDIGIFFVILICISYVIFNKEIGDLDEIWNYKATKNLNTLTNNLMVIVFPKLWMNLIS